MKILFDSQIFEIQKYGGISRYYSELFKTFNSMDNIEYELLIRNTENEYLKKIKPFSELNLPVHFLSKLKGKSILYRLVDIFDNKSNRNITIKELNKQNFDIFHPTYYSTYFLKYLKNKPFVLTIHDMIHEKYPEYFLFDINKTAINKKKLALKASKIIAISENTKRDIIKFYGIPDDKIKVIYHGNSFKIRNNTVFCDEIPQKYILFVGSRSLYKNFNNFIIAISSLLIDDKSLYVVVAGGYFINNSFSDTEKKLFIKLGIEKQIKHYSINDDILIFLYKNALLFVFPSLYEGFGMPILEAFSCNCPVVTSNTSSMPEIGGDAALYFDPTNIQNMFETIKSVLINEDLRKQLVLKGEKRLQFFSWDKTARETVEVYKSIIS